MHEITLSGTPQEMGRQHGSMLAQAGLHLPPFSPELQELAQQCTPLATAHTPELVEEMQAFVSAGQLEGAGLETMLLAGPLQQNLPSCSVVAVLPERTTSGNLLVGRNYDYGYAVSWDAATLYHTRPGGGFAHTGCSDIFIGREDGLNEAGLFTAMSATFLPGVQPGIPFWFIVRHILDSCSSVQQALAWIRSIPHSQSRNYMLADAEEALVVEASINGIHVRTPEDGVLVMTNHPVHPALANQAAFLPEDSITRYDRLCQLPEKPVTREEMQAALNDRSHHVCAHGEVFGQSFGTIWSVIAEPAADELAIACGTGDNVGTMTYRSVSI